MTATALQTPGGEVAIHRLEETGADLPRLPHTVKILLDLVAKADVVQNTQVDATRAVRIEFDSNVRKLPWRFQAMSPVIDVHPGELTQVVFEIANTTDRPLTGQAIPSYGPPNAAEYFRKLECFCFAKQTLQPGERRQMPVVFVVDAALPKDVATITLSYTFFEVEGGDKS